MYNYFYLIIHHGFILRSISFTNILLNVYFSILLHGRKLTFYYIIIIALFNFKSSDEYSYTQYNNLKYRKLNNYIILHNNNIYTIFKIYYAIS